MATEGLGAIYQNDLAPLDPEPLDVYLSDIPATDTFNAPAEAIRSPGTITERLVAVAAAARSIETERHRIAWHGSVLAEVARLSPETIDGLPEDQRQQVLELIGRMSLESDQTE
jgi:hypothetical protein